MEHSAFITPEIKRGDVFLFQGDSITDAFRSKINQLPNVIESLGSGFCGDIASQMLRERPGDCLVFYNRGVDGNRIEQLLERWEQDTLALKPNWLNILVGINDAWQSFENEQTQPLEKFESVYRKILDLTLECIPQVHLILCEPFILNYAGVLDKLVPFVLARAQVVRRLVAEYQANFVPFQAIMNQSVETIPVEYWTYDGVHPSAAGHALMAQFWLQTVFPGK
jgi:lysophospholipase L1-like esterase